MWLLKLENVETAKSLQAEITYLHLILWVGQDKNMGAVQIKGKCSVSLGRKLSGPSLDMTDQGRHPKSLFLMASSPLSSRSSPLLFPCSHSLCVLRDDGP